MSVRKSSFLRASFVGLASAFVLPCLSAATDHSLSEFPRRSGETDDTPRFQRAVDACYGGGRLSVPAGDYAFASTLYVTNLCIVQMSPTAIVRAVKPMKWMVEIDCSWEYNRKSAPKDVYSRNFNLGWSGGILDGCGLASCLALDNYAHFTLENATFNNGRVYGVGVETRGRGYELIARNIYFHTSLPGLEGNMGLWAYAGDSHFIDIISVNYTTGIHLAGRGSNRMSRCHVWGTSTTPIVKGVVPDVLKESVCFRIDATDVVMRDCYADTGTIGFWMTGWEERMECCTYAGLKLLSDAIVIRQNRGSIWANGFYPRKIAPSSVLYATGSDDARIRWGDDCLLGHWNESAKMAVKEPTADWAQEAWLMAVPDARNAAPLLIAAIDRWETTNEKEASELGKAALAELAKIDPAKAAANPAAVYAVWRHYWSTLSHPGEERLADERTLVALAKEAEFSGRLDPLRKAMVFSAAHDVTGDPHWRELELAYAGGGEEAEAGLKERFALRLLARAEKDPARKTKYRASLARIGDLGQSAEDGRGADPVLALMNYWMGRRHRIFRCR